jgi:cyclopropane fatty-acyl-phospholipid synthase-like methyltransferase
MTAAVIEGLTSYPARRRRRSLGSRLRPILRGLRWRFALRLIEAAFHVAKAGGRPYQPVEIGGRRFANVRDTDERWQAVAQVLRDHGVRNVLDIGCAEGWFVRRAAADLNLFAVGVEATDAGVVGELARLHDRVPRAATVRAFMTPEAIRGLPAFDAVLCLSVLHHVIRGFGIGVAEQFLHALATRVGKVLVFEIGTADESSWTPFLPEQSQAQETFVRELLERAGFRNVRVIAESAAYHREVQRLLFVAEPVIALREETLKTLEVA